MEFRAIDLDNAASIEAGEAAGQKRTSSGYLPPEMAAIELRRRSEMTVTEGSNLMLTLKQQLETALHSNDFIEVQRLSLELNQVASSLDREVTPTVVQASAQYDMWCFGCLLYYLCTGIQLFNVDVREDIADEPDLTTLAAWPADVKTSKLRKISHGWPKALLSKLLEKDPQKRPSNWDSIIDELSAIGSPKSPTDTPSKKQGKHVFISYSRRNKEIARQIHDHLAEAAVPTWMDFELTPGTPGWTRAIERALLEAGLVVVVCSPSSKGSEWVSKEILISLDLKIPVLPLLIEGNPEHSIPFAIYDYQHIDVRQNLDASLPMILKNTQDLLVRK